MTRPFLVALLATLARGLLAYGCGEALRLLLEYLAPGVPPPVCAGMGLILGVTLVEIVVALWHRRTGSNDDA